MEGSARLLRFYTTAWNRLRVSAGTSEDIADEASAAVLHCIPLQEPLLEETTGGDSLCTEYCSTKDVSFHLATVDEREWSHNTRISIR